MRPMLHVRATGGTAALAITELPFLFIWRPSERPGRAAERIG